MIPEDKVEEILNETVTFVYRHTGARTEVEGRVVMISFGTTGGTVFTLEDTEIEMIRRIC